MKLLDKLPISKIEKKSWPWITETDKSLYASDIKYPKITIVTPSYNQGQFLEETIRSVLLQNYPNLEYIIIDGGSTDESVSIIKKYEPWLTYWVSENDTGQSHALNKGFSRSNGKWLNWINSDDLLAKDALLKIFSSLRRDQYEIIIATGIITDENLKFIRKKPTVILKFNELIKWGQSPSQPSVFFSRQLYEKVKIRKDFHYVMDWRLWVDISCLITLDQQLILPHIDGGISRYYTEVKSLMGTYTKGYKEVKKTIKEYEKKGYKMSKDINWCIYAKRKIFIRHSKSKTLKHFLLSFFLFYRLSDLKNFVKTLFFFNYNKNKNL